MKMAVFFGILLLIVCIGIGGISYFESYKVLEDSATESLEQMARETAKVVQVKVESQLDSMEALANNYYIKSDVLPTSDKLNILKDEVKRSGHISMGIGDINGNVIYTDGVKANLSDRDNYKEALAGRSAISDPIVGKSGNILVMSYAVPIKENGKVKEVLIATRDGNELSRLISDVKYKETGTAFMLSKSRRTVANKDKSIVVKREDVIKKSQNNPDLKTLMEIEKKMIAGESGSGEYIYRDGTVKYLGYTPVKGTNWSLAISVPKREVMEQLVKYRIVEFVTIILFIIAGVLIAILIAGRISKPIVAITGYIKKFSRGDFTGSVPKDLLDIKDESGNLANMVNSMQRTQIDVIKQIIQQSTDVIRKMKQVSLEMITLNKSLQGISFTADQLSGITEETASSAEEINSFSNNIENAAKSIAEKAENGIQAVENANKVSDDLKHRALTSRKDTMELYERTRKSLQEAIEKSKAVEQIHELSNAILDVNESTNLIALNASIEAARAGEAGRGFSVVANEIKKLSEDSENTVSKIQETAKLILEAVNNLSESSNEILQFIDNRVLNEYDKIVNSNEESSENLSNINNIVVDFGATSKRLLESTQGVSRLLGKISHSSSEQANGADNISNETTGLVEMSSRVSNLTKDTMQRLDILVNTVSTKFKIE
ncbi:methyl-accepting chemotaxis protein [Clostridium sp. LBM24168]